MKQQNNYNKGWLALLLQEHAIRWGPDKDLARRVKPFGETQPPAKEPPRPESAVQMQCHPSSPCLRSIAPFLRHLERQWHSTRNHLEVSQSLHLPWFIECLYYPSPNHDALYPIN